MENRPDFHFKRISRLKGAIPTLTESDSLESRPDFTIITPARNAVATIGETLASVRMQKGVQVQHVVVDGLSTDGTQELVAESRHSPDSLISEPDAGLYDAINKGVAIAEGRYVQILNADDRFASDDVLSIYKETFESTRVDAVYADLLYVRHHPERGMESVRRYRSSYFTPRKMAWGWMPAHPTLAVTKGLLERVGPYRCDYKIAADFEWCLRAFVTHNCTFRYRPMDTVHMALGGISTSGLGATLLLNREVVRACRTNGVPTNYAKVMTKYPAKLLGRVGLPQ